MKTRITELLGIDYPVIQGGMAWVADYHLAAAVSEVEAVLAVNRRGQCAGEVVRDEIRKARELTKKPFGINVMLLSPHADDVARVVVEEGIKVVVTGSREILKNIWKCGKKRNNCYSGYCFCSDGKKIRKNRS